MEDFVTWVDTSKLKRTIMQYNDEVSNTILIHCIVLILQFSWTISICFDTCPGLGTTILAEYHCGTEMLFKSILHTRY